MVRIRDLLDNIQEKEEQTKNLYSSWNCSCEQPQSSSKENCLTMHLYLRGQKAHLAYSLLLLPWLNLHVHMGGQYQKQKHSDGSRWFNGSTSSRSTAGHRRPYSGPCRQKYGMDDNNHLVCTFPRTKKNTQAGGKKKKNSTCRPQGGSISFSIHISPVICQVE